MKVLFENFVIKIMLIIFYYFVNEFQSFFGLKVLGNAVYF